MNFRLHHLIPIIVLCVVPASLRGQSSQTPLIPTGDLSAFPTIVQAGTKPTLTWEVVLPESVESVVTITPPGTITPKRCLIMDVRVLGASVKRVWTNPQGKVTKWEWVPTQAQFNYNSQGFQQIFYNKHDKVNANSIIYSQVVQKDSTLTFGGRYVLSSGAWSPFYSSTNSSTNVRALKNGDTPPTTSPLYQQPTLESFLVPYLDMSTGKLKLGPRDVIFLMELTHTDTTHGGFDLQDLVLLVTFFDRVTSGNGTVTDCSGTTTITTTTGNTTNSSVVTVRNNNGHGNNVDGVDSSNPGNAPFTDTNPTIDDERGRRSK